MTVSNPVAERREDALDEAACRQEAARIRQERPGWVVIWLPRESLFKAYPKFRAPRGTVASAARPGELVRRWRKRSWLPEGRQADHGIRARHDRRLTKDPIRWSALPARTSATGCCRAVARAGWSGPGRRTTPVSRHAIATGALT